MDSVQGNNDPAEDDHTDVGEVVPSVSWQLQLQFRRSEHFAVPLTELLTQPLTKCTHLLVRALQL